MTAIRQFRLLTATTIGLVSLWLIPPSLRANCGSAFCSLSTDWAGQGVWREPGWRLDLRYEQIVQEQLREGNDNISLDPQAAKDKGLDHLEKQTVNRNLIATVDATLTPDLGLSVSVPYVDRTHKHLGLDEPSGQPEPEKWSFQELGDVRVLGRYLLDADDALHQHGPGRGLLFGLKLPTGRYNVENSSGERAERPLQPGTGTTDALLAGYLHDRLSTFGSYFTQLMVQEPLAERANFAPGTKVAFDTGYRYQAGESVGLMAQLNLVWKDKDRGSDAEPPDSGGTFVFLSPGAAWSATRDVQVYAFWQQPLYQYVNGIQLTAGHAFALGLGVRF
jgi:hypothetical protein